MDVYAQPHVAKVVGSITYTGLDAKALLVITQLNMSDGPELDIIRDGNRQVRSLEDATGNEMSIQVDAYPFAAAATGADATLANAAKALALPPRPGKVSLSGIVEPASNAYNGDWLYLGGGTVDENEGIAKVSFRLHRLNLASGVTIDALATKAT